MLEAIFLAAAGGLAYNVIPLLELWKLAKDARPDFRDPLFWLPFGVWPLLAGLLGYAYEASAVALTPLLALNVGVSAPLAFRAMNEAFPFSNDTTNSSNEGA